MSSFPTCQVCHQPFSLKGPVPYLLPCLHAVCETCVTSSAGEEISCSLCDIAVNLTGTRLQKDVIIEQKILHLTVKHHPELVLCTHEEDGNQAVCWCKECEEFLCEHCQTVHNSFKITKKHTIYEVGGMELCNLVTERCCPAHPRFFIDTWDKDCSMLTCEKCRFGDHAGHELVDVEKAAETARREIADFGKEIRSTDDQHKVHMSAAEADLQSSHERGSILDGKISFVFNSLKVLLDQREKELKVELQTQASNVRDQLNAKKETLETCHHRCHTISDYINNTLEYSSLYDILEMRELIEEKSQDCRSSAPSSDYKSSPPSVFNTDGLDRVQSTLAHLGAIATEDTVQTYQMQDNGTQTEEDVMKELERLTLELKQLKACQEKIIKQEQEVESTSGLYRLRTQSLEESFLLKCTDIKFSKTKYNSDRAQISTQDELINKSQTNPPYSEQRLKKYKGTSSTVPLPQCGSPQYFEVKSRVGIEETLTGGDLLLEIGLTREEEQDQSHYIGGQPQSYSLNVAQCPTHTSICREVWRHGTRLTCLPDTLENTPGSSAALHYGVVYDSGRRRIAFLDVKNERIIRKIDNVGSSGSLWPMFGVYNPHLVKVCMSLVVWSDIDMTENKEVLILESLS